MNKIFLMIYLIAACIFTPEMLYGQKNIGEFNKKEDDIKGNLLKEVERIPGANTAVKWDTPVAEIKQYINKTKELSKKIEVRVEACKKALKDLTEIPENEITSNVEFKWWTEGVITAYEGVIRFLKANIEIAEKELNSDSRKVSSEKVNEKGNNGVPSTTTSDEDFWSDNGNRTSNNTSSSSINSDSSAGSVDKNFVSASNFNSNLSHINEGEYFKDNNGQHYQRTADGAKIVDKYSYERAQANKITADFERQKVERIRVKAATTHAISTAFTSYYAMGVAGQNLKHASSFDGHFDNLEDLNYAFAQKLNEVSRMGDELKTVSVQSVQNYAQAVSAANSTGNADYTAYGQALGALGGIAAGIKADKAAKEAREELRAQREAHERSIKARQLKALMGIREEINNMFPEGGMPLSSHKIDAPVLYLFAYASNKNEWNEDKTVAMTVSNVIPVYRYSDGTYPYVANVKRTFENGGMSNPIVVGYFTDQAMAEKYQQSLVDVADQGRFKVSHVKIKVLRKDADKPASTETDFWGNQVNPDANSKKKPVTKKKEDDFWNN